MVRCSVIAHAIPSDEPAVRILQRRASTGPGHSSLRKEVTLSELTDLEASIAPPPGKPKFGSLKIRTQQSAPVGRKRSSTSSSTSAASALEAVRPRLALNLRRMSTEMIDSALEFFPRCMSPVSSVRECDGNCVESPTEKPHVVRYPLLVLAGRTWLTSGIADLAGCMRRHTGRLGRQDGDVDDAGRARAHIRWGDILTDARLVDAHPEAAREPTSELG